jgi:hypothetical protein
MNCPNRRIGKKKDRKTEALKKHLTEYERYLNEALW